MFTPKPVFFVNVKCVSVVAPVTVNGTLTSMAFPNARPSVTVTSVVAPSSAISSAAAATTTTIGSSSPTFTDAALFGGAATL